MSPVPQQRRNSKPVSEPETNHPNGLASDDLRGRFVFGSPKVVHGQPDNMKELDLIPASSKVKITT